MLKSSQWKQMFRGLSLAAAIFILPLLNVVQAGENGDQCRGINEFVEPFVETAMFDGVVMIEISGETFSCFYGFSNYEHSLRHDIHTRYRIASVSKLLTDAAFARLLQQDTLSLDDLISIYLPDFPNADQVTIRQLLNHTSGIAHTNAQPWGNGRISLSIDEIIKKLAQTPFDFEPGNNRQYSNGGYAVAAKILEVATGEEYGAAMRRLVFDPLGMNNSGHIADARALAPRMAIGYEPGIVPGLRRHTRFYAVETRPGGGSLYSTAPDMMAFVRALTAGEFVSPAFLQDVMGIEAEKLIRSEGRSPGFVAKIYRDPALDLNIVSLSNNYSVPADWAKAIAEIVVEPAPKPTWPQLKLSQEKVVRDNPILGTYDSNFGVQVAIKWRNGAVYFEDVENQLRVAMPLLSDGAFLLPIYYSICRQNSESRVIQCKILSGDDRYTQIYTPIAQ